MDKPKKPTKFTLADHCLINAATEISVARVRDRSHMDDALATFKEVLAACTRENTMIGALADACDAIIAHYRPGRASAEFTAAEFDLATALGRIHRWKHASAVSAWHQQNNGDAP